ncbi:glucose 1-dehydrogenase [Streptomyces sp. HNM0574]|uniref:SDR family NAD(P)-dependent oxidoreductase n=1 Tax=Streptomyces sp. HNM0574 TaxID=2714954 RepID=UPI00146D5523|nr:glucose 1-dehydrogenase [Streptomyces sp. HNM0574]NLU70091.1 glucose 1-dehydrogenase [Streptomyces sp. HNM0574]
MGSGSGTGRLDGRVVIISGGARGQGEQAARLFTAEGARVVLGDLLDDEGKRLAEELGPERAVYTHLDVREEADWERMSELAVERFGKVDGLLNNAGILRFSGLTDTSLAEYRQVVDVNQVGCFLGMKTVAPHIEAAGGGTIVNTASYTALAGMAFVASYAATKAAIVGMTRVAAMELAGRGVRVNAMCPGAIDTPMTNPSQVAENGLAVDQGSQAELDALYAKVVPQGRIGRPEEVARLALFLTSDDSSYVTGQPFVVDGGWLAGVSLF